MRKSALAFALLILAIPCQARVIYVDANTADNNDGTSWAKACKYLQDALADANSDPCFVEVRVADGNYYPDANTDDPNGSGDREATFQLINSVTMKGGYAGYGAPDPNARDIQLYVTILSGDINTPGDINDNSYHVVTGSGTDANTVLDAFIITAGNANGPYYPEDFGGGMLNISGNATVTNCTFSGNSAYSGGGGMSNEDSSSPTLTNCTFNGNFVSGADEHREGGGVSNFNHSSPTLTNCIFNGNSAYWGGGMANSLYSSPTVTNCIFIGNSADYRGGGVFSTGSPTLTNCTFIGNSAPSGSGGGMENGSGSPVVTNCTFSGNSAAENGGGMYNSWGNLTVTNCTFSGNTTAGDGGGMYSYRSSLTLTNCTFSGNSAAGDGGGMFNGNSNDPNLTNCTFAGNSGTTGNAIACDSYKQLYPSTVELANCILWDDGNEIWNNDGSTITITYSDVQGGWSDTGNINADPCFVDADGNDFHLLPDSPCIDAGDNTAVPGGVTTDLDGSPRFVDYPLVTDTGNGTPPIVDMGAYEYQPAIIYVDVNTPDNNDGSSWGKAYKYLQDALDDARIATGKDIQKSICVAEGTYKPDANTADPCGTGNREATFGLINGVGIYGGFAGYLEPDPNARDIQLYETILSGDLNGDDEPNFVNLIDNSHHVVTGSGTDANAVLDGFTITAGDTGMYNDTNSSPTVTNCRFSGNATLALPGGGMRNYNSSPTVTNCTFSLNSAWYGGGGMYNSDSSPTVTNCTFSGNSTGKGGGMYNDYSSDPNVSNCTFSGNDAYDGSGMYNDSSSPTVTNCTFSENIGSEGGGMNNLASSPTVTNCTFSGNSAGGYGGGMYNRGGSNPTLTNCTFTGNSATNRYGGGMYNYGSSPTLTNCTFTGNSATIRYGGGMCNSGSSSPTVTNCTFSGNSAGNYGGGMYIRDSSSPTLTNCILWGNTAASDGNEIALFTTSTIDVNYCDIKDGNDGIYKEDSNCTVNWGSGNIDANPLFLADIPDQVRLLATSPCIDAGDNDAVPLDASDIDNDGNTTESIPWDLDGRPRFADGDCNTTEIVDMGAYEFNWAYIGDFNGGCDVDFIDFSVFALTWQLEDGQPGYNNNCDISLPVDGIIDERDLDIFTDNWLEGI